MTIEKPREIALRVLLKADKSGEILDRILGDALGKPKYDARDRGLIQELVCGVVRHRRLLDFLLGKFVKRRPEVRLQTILQLGAYQLLFVSRVPDYAVLDEMVNLAKSGGGSHAARFINGVLRRITREREQLEAECESLRIDRPEVRYSCPNWLYDRWRQRFSTEELTRLLAWQNEPAQVYGRLNRLKYTPEQFVEHCQRDGLKIEPLEVDWTTRAWLFRVLNPAGLAQRPVFAAGGFYLQDPSTLHAVDLLDPQPGEQVLDLCAAPGGKTGYIADCMNNQGRVLACDTVSRRLDLVRDNCRRLGISIGELKQLPINPSEAVNLGVFDRVLVDVPCSNTGVLRRRVDLKWRLNEGEIRNLTPLQSTLLRRAAQVTKPGGCLVYSTCSLEPEENRGVVDSFLEEYRGFTLEEDRQLTPHGEGHDGAYVARLRRL